MNIEMLDLLLENRGIKTPAEKEKFINPSYERDLFDPFLMGDMERATVRIFEAVEGKEKIVIYGDYDCDGIPGSVILHDLLEKIGCQNFQVYIPDRHTEGYGLNRNAVEIFKNDGVNLIITVDLGTANVEEVALAESFGIDVIITDHHLTQDALPRAYAILNPKRQDYAYPEKMLCGSGVVFKLVQAFVKKYGEYFKISAGWEKWLLDMAGLATLSDMVPLTGENRTLAYFGMKVLQKNRRPGLAKLFKKLNINTKYLAEDDITFMIAPRLNAASRMDSPRKAYELLATRDEAEAGALADYLSKINDERKLLVAQTMKEANKVLEKREEKKVIVIGNPKWRVGVLGLVASKISEAYKKPAFIWGMEGAEVIKGSCRSDGTVNLVKMMESLTAESLLDFGGHELAGGFSVSHEQVHFLEDKLCGVYENLKNPDKKITEPVFDKKLSLEDVRMSNYKQIEKLAPFGLGNPKPVFLFEGLEIQSLKKFGKGEEHIELLFNDADGRNVKAIQFFKNEDSFGRKISAGATVNLLATFENSMFRGRSELRLRIVDII